MMACEGIGHRLMAYLDGEMSVEERAWMEEHLAACPRCQADVRAYGRMRDLSRRLRFREPPPEFWDEYPQGVLDRLGRGVGWLCIIGFGALLALYGLVCLWTGHGTPLLVKVCITGLLVGFAVLTTAVARQRLREAKTDPYKEIIR